MRINKSRHWIESPSNDKIVNIQTFLAWRLWIFCDCIRFVCMSNVGFRQIDIVFFFCFRNTFKRLIFLWLSSRPTAMIQCSHIMILIAAMTVDYLDVRLLCWPCEFAFTWANVSNILD